MAEVKRVEVKIYTVAPVFTGYIDVPPWRRLLDVLNGVPLGELRVDEEFLLVSNARISSLDGSEVTIQNAYVNKAKILFVKEVGGEETRGLGGEGVPRRYYPVVDKLFAPVKLLMPFFSLTGRMHYAKIQHLRDVLNSGPRFLPLTNVDICPAEGESVSGVSFVAVNKEQIVSVQEL